MAPENPGDAPVDLFIIGGGVNGCGIARDAAGRGMSGVLAEQGDLAQGTASAATKLFHGGLRYLEFYEFRLVREALIERETLLKAMPHISGPLRLVLPYHKGLRPRWLIRLGLFIYDHLGGRKILPPTRTLNLRTHPTGAALKPEFVTGFEYSDCWVQDARLVSLNARDAKERGAKILTRHRVVGAERQDGLWIVAVDDLSGGKTKHVRARCLVNAAGPWVSEVIEAKLGIKSREKTRLVRGSHIVTRRLFEHEQPYILQGSDNRVVFAIPYEDDFTLIGTTDVDHDGPPGEAYCTDEEKDYLCNFVSEYFRDPVTRDDIVWTYSGIRPLYDDGASSATEATRDYVLSLDVAGGAPLLNIFGGKITTYRRLAEGAMDKIATAIDVPAGNWTAGVPLPGGDFPVDGVAALIERLKADYPFLSHNWARRLVRCYGTEARKLLGDARQASDLGRDFGATLSEAEVRWLMDKEFARAADDILWRRTKLGLHMDAEQIAAFEAWMEGATKELEATA
ncbi:MAG TPA: glycerol-3-phosphate dehydrogenase [Rhodobacteraceae bacterium]|nr:glycerol-3-phosphate dehydrogenase [Paracoccaceae bacterium]